MGPRRWRGGGGVLDGVVLGGDQVGGKWVLEWADCSVRDVLFKVGCKSRGPMVSFLVKDELPPVRQG